MMMSPPFDLIEIGKKLPLITKRPKIYVKSKLYFPHPNSEVAFSNDLTIWTEDSNVRIAIGYGTDDVIARVLFMSLDERTHF